MESVNDFSRVTFELEKLANEQGWELKKVKNEFRGGRNVHYIEVLIRVPKKDTE